MTGEKSLLIIARIMICVIIAAAFAVPFGVAADADGTETPDVTDGFGGDGGEMLIDDMSDASVWNSVTGLISFMQYDEDTSYLADGEDDGGFISVRNFGIVPGESLEVSRSFDEPLSLYKYGTVGFNIFAAQMRPYVEPEGSETEGGETAGSDTEDRAPTETEPAETEPEDTVLTVPDATFRATLTLYPAGGVQPYTYTAECRSGEWTEIKAPIDSYSMRTDIVGISVSVTVEMTSAPDPDAYLSFRLDGLKSSDVRDNASEEKFFSASFQSRGGKVVYGDGCYTLTHAESGGRLIGYPVIDGRDELDGDILRFVLSETAAGDVSLEITYLNGETVTTEPQRIDENVVTALYFTVDDIGSIYTFTLRAACKKEGELKLFDVKIMSSYEKPEDVGIGTADACRVLADGSVNIRGTVPSGFVADNIRGTIGVFAVPVYEDTLGYLIGAEPCASTEMTTRYNIMIAPGDLPAGYETMRFVTAICKTENGKIVPFEDGDAITVIAGSLASFAKETGAALPASRGSVKGAITDKDGLYGMGAAASVIDIEVEELFGTANYGKLYSFGGSLYYFDNDCIASLDAKIRSSSLTGTSCYLRLHSHDGWGIAKMLSADDADGFATLYTIVDYLTSRYSSTEYGFVSGIIIGDSIATDRHPEGGDAAARAESLAREMSVVYRAGRANISDFSVMLPIGQAPVFSSGLTDPADVLYYMNSGICDEYGAEYSLLLEVADDAPNISGMIDLAVRLGGSDVSDVSVICRPTETGSASAVLAGYIGKYYGACANGSLKYFMMDVDAGQLSEGETEKLRRYFFLLDTDEYKDAEAFAGISRETDAPERSHPVVICSGFSMNRPGDIAGSFGLFDFTSSFSTSGWFPFSGSGDCSTVRAEDGRALRADAGCGGAMYSCASSPLDMTDAPIVRLDAWASARGTYELMIYSPSGIYRTEIVLTNVKTSYYFDISDFAGRSSVTGISLAPSGGGGDVFVSLLGVCSRELDGEALTARFAPTGVSDQNDKGEGQIVSIMAVSVAALALGAGTVAVLGYRSREREAKEGAV